MPSLILHNYRMPYSLTSLVGQDQICDGIRTFSFTSTDNNGGLPAEAYYVYCNIDDTKDITIKELITELASDQNCRTNLREVAKITMKAIYPRNLWWQLLKRRTRYRACFGSNTI